MSPNLAYLTGWGNTLESEYVAGALPKGRNTPRRVPYNLYTEQWSGTAFTCPRATNRRTWLYRIQPSVVVGMVTGQSTSSETAATTVANDTTAATSVAASPSSSSSSSSPPTSLPPVWFGRTNPAHCQTQVDPLRWRPVPFPERDAIDFVDGMQLVCHAGDPSTKNGIAIYTYACSESMNDRHLYNADGEFLIVPQQGALLIHTELGRLHVEPREIVVLPRGMVFRIQLSSPCRGYVLEVYKGSFQLPELGPIGSNGLANARDFQHPTAWCVPQSEYYQPCTILCKMHTQLFPKPSLHSPYNVLAWHGNYLPYKYNLQHFCAVNSVTFDHLDPSIYTVLTCPSDTPGTALADFVIFPPRIMATDENTFRPPWFHRNCMSEYMGLIYGQYDAKTMEGGFQPGGASLHNCMTPHGPDNDSYQKAIQDECLTPTKLDKGLAFMFETSLGLRVAPTAIMNEQWRDATYTDCWQDLSDQFTGWHLIPK